MSPITGYYSHSLAMVADPALGAWVAAVVAAGGTVSAGRKTIVGALIAGLQIDGVWNKLDRLWLFAAENSQSALIDVVATSAATAVNSPTFTTDHGYNGNGTSAFVNTNFNPTSGTPRYVQDACHFSLWDNSGTDTDFAPFAGSATSNAVEYAANSGATNIVWRLNCGAGPSIAKTGAKGLVILTRTGAAAMTCDQNGSQIGTATTASISPQNDTFAVCQWANTFFSGAPPVGHQVSSFGCGGSLTPTDRSNFYSRVRTYMTAVGIP